MIGKARASRVENPNEIDACIVGILLDPKEAPLWITEATDDREKELLDEITDLQQRRISKSTNLEMDRLEFCRAFSQHQININEVMALVVQGVRSRVSYLFSLKV